MRVRYEAARNPDAADGGWLVDGAEYLVLEINVNPTSTLPHLRTQFRIISSDESQTPFLQDARSFVVVDRTLPEGWSAEMVGDALFLGPTAWLTWLGQYSFWEDFWADDPEVREAARAAFDAELHRMGAVP